MTNFSHHNHEWLLCNLDAAKENQLQPGGCMFPFLSSTQYIPVPPPAVLSSYLRFESGNKQIFCLKVLFVIRKTRKMNPVILIQRLLYLLFYLSFLIKSRENLQRLQHIKVMKDLLQSTDSILKHMRLLKLIFMLSNLLSRVKRESIARVLN